MSLTVQGHAGTAPHGQDLVCAAATMLCYTMAQNAIEMRKAGWLEEDPVIKLVHGEGDVIFRPKEDHKEQAALCMQTIMTGYDVLANTYPDAVRVHYIGNSPED